MIHLPLGSPVSLTVSTSANPTILGASSAGDLVLSAILEVLQHLYCSDEVVFEVCIKDLAAVGRTFFNRCIRFLLLLIGFLIIAPETTELEMTLLLYRYQLFYI